MAGNLEWRQYDPMFFREGDLAEVFAGVAREKASELKAYIDAVDEHEKISGGQPLTDEERSVIRKSYIPHMQTNVAMNISFALMARLKKEAASLGDIEKVYDEAATSHREHYEALKASDIYKGDDFYRAQVDTMQAISVALVDHLKRFVHERYFPAGP